MIGLNENVPLCRDHGVKVMRCDECCRKLAAFEASMLKVSARPWREGEELATAYHERVDRAALENQERLHSWAVANVYMDEELPF